MWRILMAFVGLVCMLMAMACGFATVVVGIPWISERIPASTSFYIHTDRYMVEIEGIGSWHFTPGEALLSSSLLTLVLLVAAGAAFRSSTQPSRD